jgi:hypothetical protein
MARRQSEILGLFASPQDIQAQQRAQIMSEAQQMYTDPIARQLYTSAAGLAGGIGQAFGGQPVGIPEASQIEEIRKSVPFDPQDQSAYYTTLGQRLINAGLTKAGVEALQLARRAQLDEASIVKDTRGELGAADKKAIRQASEESAKARGLALTAKTLRDKYQQEKPSAGFFGVMAETWKEFVGGQDEITILKRRYNELKNSLAMSNLPPGAASDADVALALAGFPDANTNAITMERYLDGLYKASVVQQEFNNFYAKYLSDNAGDSSGVEEEWLRYADTLDWEGKHGVIWQANIAPQEMGTVGAEESDTVDWSSIQ